jgi:hypothetical protein
MFLPIIHLGKLLSLSLKEIFVLKVHSGVGLTSIFHILPYCFSFLSNVGTCFFRVMSFCFCFCRRLYSAHANNFKLHFLLFPIFLVFFFFCFSAFSFLFFSFSFSSFSVFFLLSTFVHAQSVFFLRKRKKNPTS